MRSINFIIGLILLLGCSRHDPMGDFDLPLCKGYYLVRESRNSVEVMDMQGSSPITIPSKIVEIAWDDKFILAKQQELKARGDFPGDDLLVPVPERFNYWIIDVVQTNRFGPLTEADFNAKLLSFGAANLRLEQVSQLKAP